MTYEKYIKNLELFKRKYKGIWSILIPKDPDNIIEGDLETTFDNYYCAIIRRPSIMEYSQYQTHLSNKDFISATESILNNCMVEGDRIIFENEDIFLGLALKSTFMEDTIKSLGIRRSYINHETFEMWICKEEIEEDLTYEFVSENKDKFDYFKFRKLNRNDLRDSSFLDSIITQQNMLANMCIEGDKSLIVTNEEIFYTIHNSTILNRMFDTKITYLKKN